MPEERDGDRFKRDVTSGSRLQCITRMKHFYESQFNELSRKVGEETEYSVVVTEKLLEKIEERLSEFEKREKEILDNYRKCVRETEGVAV